MPASYPPLEAYRRDLTRLGQHRTFGPDDGNWVVAGMLLERAADQATGIDEGTAVELARHMLSTIHLSLRFSSAATRVVNDIESLNAAADLIGVD